MLIFKFPFGPLETNALLIGCLRTKQAVVIDPSAGSTEAILAKAQENNLKIEKILLTHSHWDHFADASRLKAKTGAPLFVHPLDAKNVEEPGSDKVPLFISIQPVKPDGFFNDGDVIEVGDLKLEVIHCPGHSPGGVAFYMKDASTLISGDTLFKGSMGNISLPTANADAMWKSLEKLGNLPPDTRVIPGHGPETTIAHESWVKNAKQIFSE